MQPCKSTPSPRSGRYASSPPSLVFYLDTSLRLSRKSISRTTSISSANRWLWVVSKSSTVWMQRKGLVRQAPRSPRHRPISSGTRSLIAWMRISGRYTHHLSLLTPAQATTRTASPVATVRTTRDTSNINSKTSTISPRTRMICLSTGMWIRQYGHHMTEYAPPTTDFELRWILRVRVTKLLTNLLQLRCSVGSSPRTLTQRGLMLAMTVTLETMRATTAKRPESLSAYGDGLVASRSRRNHPSRRRTTTSTRASRARHRLDACDRYCDLARFKINSVISLLK